MNKKLSLTQRFSALLALFVGITCAVLFLLISAQNEPINFGKQEVLGNTYQKPLENTLRNLMLHRLIAQRALYGDNQNKKQLSDIQKKVDEDLKVVEGVNEKIGSDLQFTDTGLASRKRDHSNVKNVSKEWSELKTKFNGPLKPAESNELHAHLIGDLRTMITHLGDTSNLILDPDLDSYYLMDITLLALPQAQDRIQNAIVELEPIVRRKSTSVEDRIKASVFVSMMKEADLDRVNADFQTVLNEDPNFNGISSTLASNMKPEHKKFTDSYANFIAVVTDIAEGKAVTTDNFIASSDAALASSFSYWNVAVSELDTLFGIRIDALQNTKLKATIISLIGLLLSISVAWIFMKSLVKSLRSIVQILRNSSKQVSGSSELSAHSSTELSHASNEQAASLQETMASVEEISAMVAQNANSAKNTKASVEMNQQLSENGSRDVSEMLEAIQEIKINNDAILQQMDSSNREFSEIVKIISEIGTKTSVINEIVFQTKLLSFNASVEAARAGEHGKGFAVVAEEVGSLAQMSGNAAKEISDMLAGSIKKVQSIVEQTKLQVDKLVETGRKKIEAGHSTAENCKSSLDKITEVAVSITSMITEISVASQEQAQGVDEINKAIIQLDRGTQQNVTVSQQSSAQAVALNEEAHVLTDAVNQLILFIDGVVDENWADNDEPKETKVIPMPQMKKPTVARATSTYKKASGG